jgi:hypothetical protein
MSNNDSFIDEVTEEVRRDRLFALFRRYGWVGAVLVAAIVGGAAWVEWSRAQEAARAEAFGDALMTALRTEDDTARLAALAEVPADGPQGPLVELLVAGEAIRAGDTAAADAALKAIAADEGLAVAYRHLAELKRILLLGATMDKAERDAKLAILSEPGAPFRVLALEQQALLLAADGQKDAALEAFARLLEEPQATPALRRRVTQVIVALGGEPPAG